jgi:hypothetical protein
MREETIKKILFYLAIATLVSAAFHKAAAQNTTIHFYYAQEQTTGGEIMFALRGTESSYLGGGFSGAWDVKEVAPGHINAYDLKQKITREFNEEWCSLYAVGSLGFLGPVLVKYRGGLAVYNHKVDFENDNGYKYSKLDKAVFKPMAGVSAMYALTKDVGLEVGADTFNKVTLGFTILF